MDDQVKLAREVVEKTKADYLHLLPSMDLIQAGIASVSSVPTTFFVDENGKQVGTAYLGAKSKADWEELIEKTLTSMPEVSSAE